MTRQLPPLNALRAFDAAARVQSFTAAGRLLRVSQGAVSHHVAQLEAYLGVALFHREGRQVRLTAAGAEYAGALTDALDRVEQATRRVTEGPRRRVLRIKLFPSVAIKWLISRVAEFHSLHADLELRITTTPKLVRLDPAEDDFTIQIGNLPQPGVHYDPLIAIELLPVCAPAYLDRHPPIASPADLLHCVLLSSVQRPDDWHLWLHAAGLTRYALPPSLTFGNSALAYQAALDGMGVAIAQKELVHDDLRSGRLVPAHALSVSNRETYFLGSWEAALIAPDVAAFRRWILSKRSLGSTRRSPPRPMSDEAAPTRRVILAEASACPAAWPGRRAALRSAPRKAVPPGGNRCWLVHQQRKRRLRDRRGSAWGGTALPGAAVIPQASPRLGDLCS